MKTYGIHTAENESKKILKAVRQRKNFISKVTRIRIRANFSFEKKKKERRQWSFIFEVLKVKRTLNLGFYAQ